MKSGCCAIMRNGRNHGASEINHHQPHQSSVLTKKGDVLKVGLKEGAGGEGGGRGDRDVEDM